MGLGLGPETRPEDVNHSIRTIIWWNHSPLMVSMLQQLPEILLQPGDIQFRLAPTPLLGTLCNLEVEWTISPTVTTIDLWTYGSEQPCSSHVFTHTSPQKSPRIGIPGIQKPCYSPSSPSHPSEILPGRLDESWSPDRSPGHPGRVGWGSRESSRRSPKNMAPAMAVLDYQK